MIDKDWGEEDFALTASKIEAVEKGGFSDMENFKIDLNWVTEGGRPRV